MTIDEKQLALAERRMRDLERIYAVDSVRYQRTSRRLVIELVTGIQVSVQVGRIQGLAKARATELCDMQVSPSGLSIHWPQLDADVHVPDLMQGAFGNKKWMSSLMAAEDGMTTRESERSAMRGDHGLGRSHAGETCMSAVGMKSANRSSG